jgi:hypothetical protein
VQAFASVGAIVAGIIAIAWQVRRTNAAQNERDDKADVRRLQTIWILAYHCRVEIQQMKEVATNWPNEHTRLASKVAAMDAIPVLEIPHVQACIAVLTMVDAYQTLDQAAEQVQRKDMGSPDWKAKHMEAALLNFEFGEKQLRRILILRGTDIPDETYSINGREFPPLPVD